MWDIVLMRGTYQGDLVSLTHPPLCLCYCYGEGVGPRTETDSLCFCFLFRKEEGEEPLGYLSVFQWAEPLGYLSVFWGRGHDFTPVTLSGVSSSISMLQCCLMM